MAYLNGSKPGISHLSRSLSTAETLRRGDPRVATQLGRRLIKPFNDNLVPRPWGGTRMLAYKGLTVVPGAVAAAGRRAGEAFEISAYDADAEAQRYPSRVPLQDGSAVELSELLEANAAELLGAAFVERYGRCFPLLPKTLDIKELLSVQGHPRGNTEVYVIIDADPGATIRLGFKVDIDAARWRQELVTGQRRQTELAALLSAGTAAELDGLQHVLAPWLASRGVPANDIACALRPRLEVDASWPTARGLLDALKTIYWRVLDAMNAVSVQRGDVIYNRTPSRFLARADAVASAEVHALGNPEGKEILALEIRRPGPTFRAWDNVRFPVREIDVDAALGALNLAATTVEDFRVAPEPVPGRPGVYRSVDAASFRLEHLRPGSDRERSVAVPVEPPHCLHVIRGVADFRTSGGEPIGRLGRGESALVPVGVGAYLAIALERDTEIVKVGLPLR